MVNLKERDSIAIVPARPPQLMGVHEKKGVVYTRAWVVDVILDLAGYTPDRDLGAAIAVEPAAGTGAFVVPMIRRLVASCRRRRRPIRTVADALLVYEIDEASAAAMRSTVTATLTDLGVTADEAVVLADDWVRAADYLLDAPCLPPADYIIGNPPYIRLENMDAGTMGAYRGAYPTMKGRADIYVAFYEAALRQLMPGGVCAFICADRWMLNQYGAELRRLVTGAYGVEAVIEMHTAAAFEDDVDAYPAVTVIRRAPQGPAVVAHAGPGAADAGAGVLVNTLRAVRANGDGLTMPVGLRAARVETWFAQADPWPCVSPERLALLKRLERDFPPLESAETGTRVGIGVATGADEVFITTDAALVEGSRLLPLAMASDTFTGTLAWSGHYLVDPWAPAGLVDLDAYPCLAAHYERHRAQLEGRNVGKRNLRQWYRTIDRVNHALTGAPKLYIPDIKGHLHPVLDDGATYPHHNLYYVRSEGWDLAVLGGLLLSEIGQFFVACYGVRMQGGYLRFQAQYLRRIRVPHPCDIPPDVAAGLAHAFRHRNVAGATRLALDLYGIDAMPVEE